MYLKIKALHLRVIVLDHQAHRPDGTKVLVNAIGTEVMQRFWGAGISIRASEIYPHLQPSKYRHLVFNIKGCTNPKQIIQTTTQQCLTLSFCCVHWNYWIKKENITEQR